MLIFVYLFFFNYANILLIVNIQNNYFLIKKKQQQKKTKKKKKKKNKTTLNLASVYMIEIESTHFTLF